MTVQLNISTKREAHIIKNLYPIYLHELSAYSNDERLLPNNHGVLGEDEPVRCACRGQAQEIWWSKPGVCLPFLVRLDGAIIGFVLAATSPHTSPASDFSVYEFFILNPYRRRGLGRQAALKLFKDYPGRWELNVLNRNIPAQAFWSKVIGECANGTHTECESPAHIFPDCRMYMFNTKVSARPL